MAFKGSKDFSHQQTDKTGVLITNLGTPDAPDKRALKRYLKQFLSDPRVVEIPRLLWLLILHLVILRIRPKRSAEAYRSIWTEQGSPLMFHTQAQCKALQSRLRKQWGEELVVEFAMRYGQPAIDQTIQSMCDSGVRRLLVLPLYPQYSGSTTASSFDALAEDFRQRRWLPALRFVNSYHDFAPYIKALAAQVRAHWDQHGRAELLLMSYHGVPRRYLEQGDPYYCQCHVSSRLLAAELGLNDDDYMVTFQSRFGKAEWLQPYTDKTLMGLPAKGVKRVQIVCPGFSADCLETIEEIAVENRDYFLENGGESYEYIPALNDTAEHIEALAHLIEENLQGWPSGAEKDYALRQQQFERKQHEYENRL